MSSDLLAQITTSIVNGDPDRTLALTKTAIGAGLEPMSIIGVPYSSVSW